jgi:hypothetical protein
MEYLLALYEQVIKAAPKLTLRKGQKGGEKT